MPKSVNAYDASKSKFKLLYLRLSNDASAHDPATEMVWCRILVVNGMRVEEGWHRESRDDLLALYFPHHEWVDSLDPCTGNA